jgi:hypothetical protein
VETKFTLHFLVNGSPRSAEYSSLKDALERARGLGPDDIICIKGPDKEKIDQAAIAKWCRENPPLGMEVPSTQKS